LEWRKNCHACAAIRIPVALETAAKRTSSSCRGIGPGPKEQADGGVAAFHHRQNERRSRTTMTQKAKLKGYADFRERIKEERVQIGGRSTPLPDAGHGSAQ
jgi:hypothetical protein